MTPLEEAAHRFLDSVEAVFHSDWAYTRSDGLCLDAEGRDPDDGATFLAPKMSASELERQNWGNYEGFLETYKALCLALGRTPIK